MHERPAFDCKIGQHFPDFRRFSPECQLFVALLSRRASSCSPDRGRLRPCPRRLVGACTKFETQALSPRSHCLSITALRKIYRVFLCREYPIRTSLIFLRLHAIPLLLFQPSMLSNTQSEYGCIYCKPSCSSHAGQTPRRRKTFPLHSGSSSSWFCSRQLLLLTAAPPVVYQRTAENHHPQCLE